MEERLVGGQKYRILTDAVNDVWDRISFWTKASDVIFDDNTNLEQNKPINVLTRRKVYRVGDIAYEPTAPSWAMLWCSTSGTTQSVVPTRYATATPGADITDGDAHFRVFDVRVETTLSNNAYKIPSMSLVNNLNSQLIANGQEFQFAYDSSTQKYGFKAGSDGPFMKFSGDKSDYTEQTKTSSTLNASNHGHTFTFNNLTRVDAIVGWSLSGETETRISAQSITISGNTVTLREDNGGYRPAGSSDTSTGNHTVTIKARQYHAFD